MIKMLQENFKGFNKWLIKVKNINIAQYSYLVNYKLTQNNG